jgi:hypothetical protein
MRLHFLEKQATAAGYFGEADAFCCFFLLEFRNDFDDRIQT